MEMSELSERGKMFEDEDRAARQEGKKRKNSEGVHGCSVGGHAEGLCNRRVGWRQVSQRSSQKNIYPRRPLNKIYCRFFVLKGLVHSVILHRKRFK